MTFVTVPPYQWEELSEWCPVCDVDKLRVSNYEFKLSDSLYKKSVKMFDWINIAKLLRRPNLAFKSSDVRGAEEFPGKQIVITESLAAMQQAVIQPFIQTRWVSCCPAKSCLFALFGQPNNQEVSVSFYSSWNPS